VDRGRLGSEYGKLYGRESGRSGEMEGHGKAQEGGRESWTGRETTESEPRGVPGRRRCPWVDQRLSLSSRLPYGAVV